MSHAKQRARTPKAKGSAKATRRNDDDDDDWALFGAYDEDKALSHVATPQEIHSFASSCSRKCGVEGGSMNILLFGSFGAGKSSTVNTLFTALQEDDGRRGYRHIAKAAGDAEGEGVTRTYESYPLTENIRLFDSWGWSAENYEGGQFQFILEGRLPEDWECTHTVVRSEHLSQTPEARRIHAIMFLVPANAYDNDEYYSRMKVFVTAAREHRVPAIVILSQVDKLDKAARVAPASMWTSKEISQARQVVAKKSGFAPSQVFPLVNYREEIGRHCSLEGHALFALLKALCAAEDSLDRDIQKGRRTIPSSSSSSAPPPYEAREKGFVAGFF